MIALINYLQKVNLFLVFGKKILQKSYIIKLISLKLKLTNYTMEIKINQEVESSLSMVSFAYDLLLSKVSGIKQLSYSDQAMLINLEFDNLHATERQIAVINDSTVEDDIIDLQLNVGVYYGI